MSSSALTATAVRTPTRFSPTTFFTMAMPSAAAAAGATGDANGVETTTVTGAGCGGHAVAAVPSFFLFGPGGTTPKSSHRQKRAASGLRAQQQRQDANAVASAKNGGGGKAPDCPKSPCGGGVPTCASDKSINKRQPQNRSKCQQQKLGGAGTEALAAPTTPLSAGVGISSANSFNGICATPSSRHQQRGGGARRYSIRREQSASAIAIPPRRHNTHHGNGIGTGCGANSVYASLCGTAHPYAGCYTPPCAIFYSHEDYEVSPIFAGPKFIESPSAKSLPLPPSQWLEAYNNNNNNKALVDGGGHDENESMETELQHNQKQDGEGAEEMVDKQFERLSVAGTPRRAGHSSFSECSSTSSSGSTTTTNNNNSSSCSGSASSDGEQYPQHNTGIIPGNWSPPAKTVEHVAAGEDAKSKNMLNNNISRCNTTPNMTKTTVGANKTPNGIRMDPLHLIQACYP